MLNNNVKLATIGSLVLISSLNASSVVSFSRMALIAQVNSEYHIDDAGVNKLSNKLLEKLSSDDGKKLSVDIFISDKVDSLAYSQGDVNLKGQATYTFDLDTNQSSYTLNGEKADTSAIDQYMYEQNQIFAQKHEMRASKRKQNLQRIASLLKKPEIAEISSEYISLQLSRRELADLLKNADDAVSGYDVHSELSLSNTEQEWDAERDGYLQGVSLTQMHGVWNSSFPNTRGEGIGMYYSDAFCPYSKSDLYYGYDVTSGSFQEVGTLAPTSSTDGYHTRVITGILGTVANAVNLYCHDMLSGDIAGRLPSTTYSSGMSNINVETYSVNNYNDISRTYRDLDAAFDHHSYNNRTIPIFVSAANSRTSNTGLLVLSPAKAFNVTTVGSYYRQGVGDQRHSSFSAYVDPTTQVGTNAIRKPEVSAPGEHFHCSDITGGDTSCPSANEVSGTSFATPWTAAMAADLMSQGSYWQSSAAMVKAVVISGASDPVSGTRDTVGEGGVDLFTMTWQNTNSAYSYDMTPSAPFAGTNPSQFDYDDNCFTNWQTYLYGTREQRIVISWLNDVSSATTLSNVPNSYKLELLNSSGIVVASASEDTQGYQIINTQQPSGTYTVRVCKVRQNSSQRFDMGFSVSQRYEDASVWDQ